MVITRQFAFALAGALLISAPVFPQAVLLFDNGPSGIHLRPRDDDVDPGGRFRGAPLGSCDQSRSRYGGFRVFPANWDHHLRWWIHEDSGGLPGPVVATGFAPEVWYTLDLDDCPNRCVVGRVVSARSDGGSHGGRPLLAGDSHGCRLGDP